MNALPLRPRPAAWSTNRARLVSATHRLTAITNAKNINNTTNNAS